MKKIVNKIAQVLQILLAAPVKLPRKAAQVLKYVAVALGIVETVLDDTDPPTQCPEDPPSETSVRVPPEEAGAQQERRPADEAE